MQPAALARLLLGLAIILTPPAAQAGPLRRLIQERMAQRQLQPVAHAGAETIAYGADPAQRLDLYALPTTAERPAPIIVMVHGGAWKYGDKAMPPVVDNKLAHWNAKGFLFASVNYRMVPAARPDEQARDVARAIARIQAVAPAHGGDPERMIVMGHSAGGHLVALLSADPARAVAEGARPWAASVILDAGALNVPAVMAHRHPRLYDDAFGRDPLYWPRVSPMAAVTRRALPMMLICSLKRPDDSCGQSKAFAARLSAANGQPAPVLPQALNHREINETLGLPGTYTDAVDAFIAARLRP